ncbi:MAG: nicotinate phosphoribosyltransferase [Acidimicrobiia bacterium]|nr:nicotinate phosphoribosyltransferase [Acidimicrobiia bacterium]
MDRSLAEGVLFTDQYQLTMSQLYFRMGIHEQNARFEHFFRRYPDYGPHEAGYCITAGQAWFLEWAASARFGDTELDAIRSQRTVTGGQMFGDDFLEWLSDVGGFGALDITGVPEGRVVHANVPMTVVEGPLSLAQIIETPLLNQLNFQTLIATKASRVRVAAGGGSILEFGMRRAADRGATAASRASLVGGADYTSAVGVSHLVGFPPKGTHAHSMVQVFMAMGDGELGAFRAYADVYPDECLLLVDTIDTLESGVPNAIKVFEELRRKGHEPVGIRLDSGDLAHLAVRSSAMLDAAGFEDPIIVLSSGLDELAIWQIQNQIIEEAPRYGTDADRVISRLVYGVGTKMATSEGAPNLDGVFKLVAYEDGTDGWLPAIKLSDTPAKVVNPGRKKVLRLYDERGVATADVLALADETLETPFRLNHHSAGRVSRVVDKVSEIEDLLEPFHIGPVDQEKAIVEARTHRDSDMERLDPGVMRLVNPHVYHVSISDRLFALKQELINDTRKT